MFTRSLLLSALATYAAAQSKVLFFTHVPNPITDGEKQAITYSTNDTQSPVTIILRQGDSNNLQTVETLTKSSVGGQFIWTPSASLPNGNDYALEITQGSQMNYYGPFIGMETVLTSTTLANLFVFCIVQGAVPASVSAASMYMSSTTSMYG